MCDLINQNNTTRGELWKLVRRWKELSRKIANNEAGFGLNANEAILVMDRLDQCVEEIQTILERNYA